MKISFWAYKGGTGRSLLLANVALELANQGYNVGVIDLDYEAPGLFVIFDLIKEDIIERGSLIDLLIQKTTVNLNKIVIDLKSKFNTTGNIYFLPTIDDTRFDEVEWNDENCYLFLNNLLKEFTKYYQLNHLLIDTRTGFSTGSAYAKNLSDFMIITMRPNRQNILGVSDALKGLAIDRKENYFLVCSEVIQNKNTKQVLKSIESKLQKKIDAIIPYEEILAFEERLLVNEMPNSMVANVYKQITEKIKNK